MVNLSAQSVKHFLPNAEIHCFTLYKHSISEYDNQELVSDYIAEHRFQTRYINPNEFAIHDCADSTKTSGYANPNNGLFFAEGFNLIFDYFKDVNEPVIMLSEDHFFTTGKVLKELISEDYDVAFASGDHEILAANAALLSIVPSQVRHLFPLKECRMSIEPLLKDQLITKVNPDRLYQIVNRKWIDYCGDGIYTNSSEEIRAELIKAGIL